MRQRVSAGSRVSPAPWKSPSSSRRIVVMTPRSTFEGARCRARASTSGCAFAIAKE